MAVCISVNAFSQSAISSKLPLTKFDRNLVKPASKFFISNPDAIIPYANTPIVSVENESTPYAKNKMRGEDFRLGGTTFDNVISNQQLSNGPNGTLSAVWTGSSWIGDFADTANLFNDRGTYYRYFNGTNWGPEPTSRIEPIYSGYPASVFTGHGGEFMASNNSRHLNTGVASRPTAGSGTWSYKDSTASKIFGPRLVSWGNTVHLLGTNIAPGGRSYPVYSRSSDGGVTWDIVDKEMPIDTACTNFMWSYAYAMDVRGNTVAIVGGGITTSVYLWKSTDGGNTFDSTQIWNFPVCRFDGKTLSDANGDGVADTIAGSDGYYAILLDNNDNAHVFMGFTNLTDADTAEASFTYFYGPGTSGILHWNETEKDSLYFVGRLLDVDEDGILGIGRDYPIYDFGSQCSMPTVSMDTTTNTMYCVFSMAVENTDLLGDPTDPNAQSYRDLYGVYSTDNGQTWSEQVNLTNSAVFSKENVYPNAARYTNNGEVNVMWIQDGEPGNSFDTHQKVPDPIHPNDIMFRNFKMDDFTGIKPVKSPVTEELTVYPNPSNGIFYLSAVGLQSEKATVTVTNILGEKVKSISNFTVKQNMYMNLSDVASGVYFVKIETGHQVFSGKLIIGKN